MYRFFIVLVGALISATAQAERTFSAGITGSQWYLATSIFECTLTHNIPRFGRAVFYREAGESLRFYLDSPRNPMRSGEAALAIEAPRWRPGSGVRPLGFVPVNADSNRPVELSEARAEQMFDSLMQGYLPTFTRRARFNDESVRVEVSAVNFAGFYNDYLNCVASLLPVNFRQVERTAVFFDSDDSTLSPADMEALDRVILYVKADPAVTAIFVDGHADATGRRIYNRRLSKSRAEVVHAYLVAKGLAEEKITLRYHGERYPVADNQSAGGKAKNRRATVRLEKGTRPMIPAEGIDFEIDDSENSAGQPARV